MLKFLPLLLPLTLAFSLQSNAQAIDWMGTTTQPIAPNPNLSTFGRCIAVDQQGNVYSAMSIGTYTGNPTQASYQIGGVDLLPLSTDYTAAVLMKQSSDGTVLWAKQWEYTGSYSGIGIETIALSPAGDVYVGGVFQDNMDFDPNSGVFEIPHANPTIAMGYVMKLSSDGDFIWVRDFQRTGPSGQGEAQVTDLSFSGDAIVIVGDFRGAVTIGEPVVSSSSISSTDYGRTGFAAKFTADGDFVWIRQIYGANQYYDMRVNGVSTDASGNVYLTGGFKGFVRFNGIESNGLAGSFGSILENTPSQSPKYDIFTAAYNSDGDLIWMRALSYTQEDTEGYAVAADDQGNVYSTGFFRGLTQFQGTAHTVGNNDESNPSESIYLCKQGLDGSVEWVREFGKGIGWSVAVDAYGIPVFSGSFEGEADFDPGLGANILTSVGAIDAFVCRMDDFGSMVWVRGFSTGYGWSVAANEQTIYATGLASLLNDGSPGSYNSMFNVKFFPDEECFAFNAIISDILELDFETAGSIEVTAYGGMEPYTYVWNTDPPQFGPTVSVSNAGLYHVTVTDEMGCERTIGAILSGPEEEELGEFDLQVNLAMNLFSNICNTNGELRLDAFNSGSLPVSGTLTLNLGPDLTYVNAVPPATSVSGSTISWDFLDMNSESGPFKPRIWVNAPPTVPPGTFTCYSFSISLLEGDLNPTNNFREFCIPLLCSYDPNDKMVYPQGEDEEGFVMNNQTMTYTIRFQNTGTAPAFNVFILDTIHPNLDISTLKVLGHSHPMVTEWAPGNQVKFRFDNIMLPDSASNEPESHGYVIFEIAQMLDLEPGEQMLNTVYIYFDLNEPIQTNTVVNTIPFPVDVPVSMDEPQRLTVFPNPARDHLLVRSHATLSSIRLYNAQGQLVFHRLVNSEECVVDVSSFSSGLYLLEATGEEGRSIARVVRE
jgi:uncharacterized repeat protein (TIGR01451 family)